MEEPKQFGEKTDTSEVMGRMLGLDKYVDELGAVKDSFRLISTLMPPRVSLRMGLAFLFVAHANANGRRVTMTDVREYFMEIEGGSVNVGQSIAKSFQIFFDACEQEPQGLNWIIQEYDKVDRRKKYLRTTAEGADVAIQLVEQIHQLRKNNDVRVQGQEEV